MYEKIEGGKQVNVHGLKCWIPPVGYGYHHDPDQARELTAKGLSTNLLEQVDILKRSNKKEEQYWERPVMPPELLEWKTEEENRQLTDPNYHHPELMKIIRREWHRRRYGVWFYNNGVATYLTGTHYFYLTHWKIDIGYPRYRKVDKEYFYFWQYCVEDPRCTGMINIEKRRNGKTYRSCCILFETISRTANSTGGIQSKTGEDAKIFFQKKLVPSFTSLPYFFIPEYDTSKGDIPKEEISFFRTSKKGKQKANASKAPALQSSITFRDSKPKAYDGQKLKIYIGDESGKVQINVMDRHQVLDFCVRDEQNNVIGKMLITSTVEELGVRYGFDKLWAASNQFDRNATGETKSGMYKLFTSAQESGRYDVYGEPFVEETIKRINARRAELSDSVEELNSYIRKEPMTEEEAFYVDAKQCHFNPNTLNFRLSDLGMMNSNYKERGNFMWENGIRDKKVIWVPDVRGRWEIPWMFEAAGQSNKIIKKGNQYYPDNGLLYVSGCDPFDHDVTEDNSSRSKGASFTLKRHNPYEANHTYNKAFVAKYCHRPELAYMFYEDMIMQCVFYGSPLLVENNKQGIIKYFEGRGYKGFLIHLADYKEAGIPSNTENKILMLETTQEYTKNHIDKVFYPDLIQDWLKFDVTNTQKYDLSMAAGWTLFADRYGAAKKGTSGLKDITKLFKKHAA